MAYTSAKQQFINRYYSWALREMDRELQGGFPWLSRIRSEHTLRLMDVLRAWEPEQIKSLLAALAKNWRRNTLAQLARIENTQIAIPAINCDDAIALDRWREAGHSGVRPPKSLEFYRRLGEGDPATGIPRGSLLAAANAAMLRRLALVPYHTGGEEVGFRVQIGACQLGVGFDCGGYARQLEADFKVTWPGEPLWRAVPVGVLPCLAMQRMVWELHYRGDIDEMARTAVDLCCYLVGALTPLLEGLDVKPDEAPPANPEVVPVDVNRKLPLFDSQGEESDGR